MYILRIEKCGQWGLPNAEPEGWKNADPEDYQKRRLRIAKCGSRELNNVIAETQEILMRKLKNVHVENWKMRTPRITKSGARGLKKCRPQGLPKAEPDICQMWSPSIKQCDSWDVHVENWNMRTQRITKCRAQGDTWESENTNDDS